MIMTKRKPMTVGKMLTEEFLEPLNLTQVKLAELMGVERRTVNELCNNKRGVTADTAFMLSKVFGNTPDFWLNLQQKTDLWEAWNTEKSRVRIDKATAFTPHLVVVV